MGLLLPSPLAWSASPDPLSPRIAQMNHRAWVIKDGAPADIWAMVQGSDGFIWLGTGSGLFRFDGMQFERYAPSANRDLSAIDITALMQAADGSLWIGFLTGEVGRLDNGRVVTYAAHDGLFNGMVYNLSQTQDGAIWVAATTGLLRYMQGHWEKIGADWSYPYARATWSLEEGWQGNGQNPAVCPVTN